MASNRVATIAVVLAMTIAWAGSSVAQEVSGDVQSRGVKILQPDAEPPPDPKPAPPPPKPAPPPTPVATPAVAPVAPPAAPPAPVVADKPVVTAPQPAPAIQLCTRPFERTDIALPVDGGFDRLLSRKLKSGKRVTVNLVAPYPEAEAAPAPIAAWLTAVKDSGGRVEVKQYCEAARGGLSNFFAKLFGSPEPGRVYRPARKYDAVLHSDALDRVITQIEFVPRAAATSS